MFSRVRKHWLQKLGSVNSRRHQRLLFEEADHGSEIFGWISQADRVFVTTSPVTVPQAHR